MNTFALDPSIPYTTLDWGNWQHEFDPEKPPPEKPQPYCYMAMSPSNPRDLPSLGYTAYLDSALGMGESPASTNGAVCSTTTHCFFEKPHDPLPHSIPPSVVNTKKRPAAFEDEIDPFSNAFSALNHTTTTVDEYITHPAKRQRKISYDDKVHGFTPSPTFSDPGYATQQSSPTFSPVSPTITTTTTPTPEPSTEPSNASHQAAIREYKASVHASMQKTFYKKFLRPTFKYPAQARDQLAPIMKGVALNRPEDRPMETKIILHLDFKNNKIRGERRMQRRKVPRECDTKMREAEGKDYLNPRGYGKRRFCVETGQFVERGRDGRRR
ncbi:hypothetical protein EX30DRAFT_370540 [Ascodesmis nigricans]|uniref:Uncharacterized protein n=1 Tax=Ascodesmis nigricans TaxID=341454 RepID=A0A4V6RHG3_9PEZI|nr:hypothetical protein EX30DRAFT_370540 [Ascodesmis nigricans]